MTPSLQGLPNWENCPLINRKGKIKPTPATQQLCRCSMSLYLCPVQPIQHVCTSPCLLHYVYVHAPNYWSDVNVLTLDYLSDVYVRALDSFLARMYVPWIIVYCVRHCSSFVRPNLQLYLLLLCYPILSLLLGSFAAVALLLFSFGLS
jgi:hypothetical protein